MYQAERIEELVRRAAQVQDRIKDLDAVIVRGKGGASAMSALKSAWKEFRDAALIRP